MTTNLARTKNRTVAKILTRFPSLSKGLVDSYAPWESEDIPWTPVTKPLGESRIALVTTAGVHHKDQEPFNMVDPEGDPTFREIDSGKPLSGLMITHDYYDHSDADKDMNIVFPIERLREFQAKRVIGGLADTHYSFMGHIDGRHIPSLMERQAPEVARRLKADGVDLVILTPGWGICNQSVGLIQREIEKAGIPTIGISIVRRFTEKVKPPRTIFLKWPFGHPLGEPFHTLQQRVVLMEMFQALYSIHTPGEIRDIALRWKKEDYSAMGSGLHIKHTDAR